MVVNRQRLTEFRRRGELLRKHKSLLSWEGYPDLLAAAALDLPTVGILMFGGEVNRSEEMRYASPKN